MYRPGRVVCNPGFSARRNRMIFWETRSFKWIICVRFGGACLIPSLGLTYGPLLLFVDKGKDTDSFPVTYLIGCSASSHYQRLEAYIVPRTGPVSLSSQVCLVGFFYDWKDRITFKKGKPLPELRPVVCNVSWAGLSVRFLSTLF